MAEKSIITFSNLKATALSTDGGNFKFENLSVSKGTIETSQAGGALASGALVKTNPKPQHRGGWASPPHHEKKPTECADQRATAFQPRSQTRLRLKDASEKKMDLTVEVTPEGMVAANRWMDAVSSGTLSASGTDYIIPSLAEKAQEKEAAEKPQEKEAAEKAQEKEAAEKPQEKEAAEE